MTWSPKKASWVAVADNGARFVCRRCGGKLLVRLPMPASAWVKSAETFVEEHSGCQESAET